LRVLLTTRVRPAPSLPAAPETPLQPERGAFPHSVTNLGEAKTPPNKGEASDPRPLAEGDGIRSITPRRNALVEGGGLGRKGGHWHFVTFLAQNRPGF